MNRDKVKTTLQSLRNSIIFRLLIIGILILLLLIPFSMILSLIDERKNRSSSVIAEISSKWAYEQSIKGPVLDIPYNVYHIKTSVNNKGKEIKETIKEVKTAHFLPDNLDIQCKLIPKVLYRGIYKAVVYTADLTITGSFTYPDFKQWNIDDENINWADAVLSFGISDMRGINSDILLNWNKETLQVKPGITNKDIFNHGVNTHITSFNHEKNEFVIKLDLRGSNIINFYPLGRQTIVSMHSNWKSPSFNGLFLPKSRTVDESGFNAQWEIYDYNRDFPQAWSNSEYQVTHVNFGVQLFTPVDEYQKTTRSAKYAVLFISLTFLTFFLLVEILNKRRIHPIQYLLIGFALCMFYTLLVSLSEHISFNLSYLIAAVSIIVLTTMYFMSVAGKKVLAVILGIMMTGLYGFLFVIIQLEDYSLLFGSTGLFIILASIMIFTRKFDWYALSFDRKQSVKENIE